MKKQPTFDSVKDTLQLTDCYELTHVKKSFSVPDRLNVICVNEKLYSACRFDKMLLVEPETGNYIYVTLTTAPDVGDNTFLATTQVVRRLNLTDNATVNLYRLYSGTYQQIMTQRIENIRENNIVVSKFDANGKEIDLKNFSHYEIYNLLSGGSIVVKTGHIIIDPDLCAGTIRLNRKQRLFLGLELPRILTEEQWDFLKKRLTPDEMNEIISLYGAPGSAQTEDADHNVKKSCKKIIKKNLGLCTKIIPVLETVREPKKNIINAICDFYVGKSTISLMAKRPFENDEGLDIVRMTRSNMNLLGIDEMDKVVLQYKNKKISCRVLDFENENSFLKTNKPSPMELSVGIPVHIRNRLGIDDLSSAVKIDRDTVFIFKKSLNEQVVPIILTVFSAILFSDFSALASMLLSIIAIPIVVYFNLSSKRNMRA